MVSYHGCERMMPVPARCGCTRAIPVKILYIFLQKSYTVCTRFRKIQDWAATSSYRPHVSHPFPWPGFFHTYVYNQKKIVSAE